MAAQPKAGGRKAALQRYYRKNRKAILAKNRAWYRKNKKRRRAYNIKNQQTFRLRNKYGLTVEQFEKMVLAQQGRCAICGNTFKNSKDTHVDHNHATGRVRGLLCYRCNHGLGKFKDSEEALLAAAKYVRKYRKREERLGR